MKKLYLAALLISVCNGRLCAMQSVIKLPSAHIINQTLCTAGFGHFVKETQLDTTLGGEEKHPSEIAKDIKSALYKYHKHSHPNPFIDLIIEGRTTSLVRTILQDHPHAIEAFNKHSVTE